MISKMNEEEWFKQEKALWEHMWDDHNGDPTTYAMESAWMSQEYDNLTAEEEIELADKNDAAKWKDTILDVVRRAIGLDTIKDGISYEILKPYFEDIANIGIGGFSKNSIAIELPGLKSDVCDHYLEIGVYAEEEGEYSPLTFEIDFSTENCMTKTGSDDNIDCIEVIDIPEKILQRYQDRQEAFELY